MTTSAGRAWDRPGPVHSQVYQEPSAPVTSWSADSTMPRPRPAATAMPKEVNRASSAAAKTGTTSRVRALASRPAIGLSITPAIAARTKPTAQVSAPMSTGDRPLSEAPFSLSEMARTARPMRVRRETTARTAARTTAIAARIRRSIGRFTPRTTIGVEETTEIGVLVCTSKSTVARPWSSRSSASVAMIRASTGELRNCRMTAR